MCRSQPRVLQQVLARVVRCFPVAAIDHRWEMQIAQQLCLGLQTVQIVRILGTIRTSISATLSTSATGIRIDRTGTLILGFRVRAGGLEVAATGMKIGTTIVSITITIGTTVVGMAIGEAVGMHLSCGEGLDGGSGRGPIAGEAAILATIIPTTLNR